VDRGLSLVDKIVTAYDYIVSVAFAGATCCELRLDQVDYRVLDTRRRSLCSRLRGSPGLRRIRGGSPWSLTASEAIKQHVPISWMFREEVEAGACFRDCRALQAMNDR
jgi:hypothetical protein